MNELNVFSIGTIENKAGGCTITLEPQYAAGLTGLEAYSHVQILWWMGGCDNAADRSTLIEEKPYRRGPEKLGVFALRSPERPNPIAVSNAQILSVDVEKGVICLAYLDAFDQSRVIDLKPYTPSIDRIEHPGTPGWCSHWPKCYEESGSFDWASEFNF